jgi:hypothetical protein
LHRRSPMLNSPTLIRILADARLAELRRARRNA